MYLLCEMYYVKGYLLKKKRTFVFLNIGAKPIKDLQDFDLHTLFESCGSSLVCVRLIVECCKRHLNPVPPCVFFRVN